jgi:hypothetical protein
MNLCKDGTKIIGKNFENVCLNFLVQKENEKKNYLQNFCIVRFFKNVKFIAAYFMKHFPIK